MKKIFQFEITPKLKRFSKDKKETSHQRQWMRYQNIHEQIKREYQLESKKRRFEGSIDKPTPIRTTQFGGDCEARATAVSLTQVRAGDSGSRKSVGR